MRSILKFAVSIAVADSRSRTNHSDAQKARVFITDSQSWQMTGNSGGRKMALPAIERRRPSANRGDHQDLRRPMLFGGG